VVFNSQQFGINSLLVVLKLINILDHLLDLFDSTLIVNVFKVECCHIRHDILLDQFILLTLLIKFILHFVVHLPYALSLEGIELFVLGCLLTTEFSHWVEIVHVFIFFRLILIAHKVIVAIILRLILILSLTRLCPK